MKTYDREFRFTQSCPCWEERSDTGIDPVCADKRNGQPYMKHDFFNRIAYHMFASINGYITKDMDRETFLNSPYVASRIYKSALKKKVHRDLKVHQAPEGVRRKSKIMAHGGQAYKNMPKGLTLLQQSRQ